MVGGPNNNRGRRRNGRINRRRADREATEGNRLRAALERIQRESEEMTEQIRVLYAVNTALRELIRELLDAISQSPN
uniref:BZIP domain-containing protein n=1 Tax=Steinernema glaseri TaxID=37863 RepID=A0A1I7ZSZ6_9BILA